MSTTRTPSAPARPRDGRNTRDSIVSAATRLIHVHGYHATSLDDVLRESGVGKGNFYYYFKSKEDLGYAILDKIVDGFLDRTLEPCFADTSAAPLGQIRCFLDRVVQAQRERNCVGGCVMGNLASELSDVHEGFRTRLATLFTAWQARLAGALESARRRGELSPDAEPEMLARFLVASLEGAILLAKLSKDVRVMEQCVAELKRYLALHEVRS
jgi:TetR/AcrR family transcriptional repressor of nem operon